MKNLFAPVKLPSLSNNKPLTASDVARAYALLRRLKARKGQKIDPLPPVEPVDKVQEETP